MATVLSTAKISWEYFMPQHRERAGRYIRESDYSLLNSTTIESGAKLVNEYCERQGYICEPDMEWREAESSYEVPYMERLPLQQALNAAKNGLIDVLVIPEIRALSRRQVEILVLYDMLLKYNVRLETVKEKFGEDGMSKAILSLRAMFSEIEVEQLRMRVARGKADRVLIGKAPKSVTPFYTHILIDTAQETKGQYILNEEEVVYIDGDGKAWTRVDVAVFFCDLLAGGGSLNGVCRILNNMGIPSPGGKLWQPAALNRIVRNPLIYGQPYANRYVVVEKRKSKNGKHVHIERLRPQEEWIALPPCPGVITKEKYDQIQTQIGLNKAESIRNNQQDDPANRGLVRSGYIFCGICGRQMRVCPPSRKNTTDINRYYCKTRYTDKSDVKNNHRCQISMAVVDAGVKAKIVEVLNHPEIIRRNIEALRNEKQKEVDPAPIYERIAKIDQEILNFFELAKHATTKEMIAGLAHQMNMLEGQKREAQKLLLLIEDDQEERLELEAELQKFEAWVAKVRPFLTDPAYMEKAEYDELRLAVRIIGLKVTVFPAKGDWEFRFDIVPTVPEIMKKLFLETRTSS